MSTAPFYIHSIKYLLLNSTVIITSVFLQTSYQSTKINLNNSLIKVGYLGLFYLRFSKVYFS